MTMQSDGPLVEANLNTTNRPMAWLIDRGLGESRGAMFDLDQPYQRGHVWGVARRQNLIRSVLMGVPIASIVVNDRHLAHFNEPGYPDSRNWAYAIVDGKQRVTTIMMFGRDEFAVPASWFRAGSVETTEDTEDGPYVRYSGLTETGRRRFENKPLAVSEGRFPTLADERMIFELVNYGGVHQGDVDEDLAVPTL